MMTEALMRRVALSVVCAGLAVPAFAAPSAGTRPPAKASAKKAAKAAAPAVAEEDALMARLRKLYPGTTFASVSKTPIKGVFEVVMGRNIAYVGPEGTHFLFGHLFDMQRQVDMTAERQTGVSAATSMANSAAGSGNEPVNFKDLPLQDAIKRVNGNGQRVLAVFSDPLCPYCKKLEASLPELADATIYTFLVPILGEGSRRAAEELWRESVPERASDLAVIDRNLKLASRYGVRGTPTLVRADGQVESGALDINDLNRWIGDVPSSTAQLASPTNSK